MNSQLTICGVILAALVAAAPAQVASHAPSLPVSVPAATVAAPPPDQPVAKVNGTVLTQRDLLREMYTIFPYARQHGGFPKGQESQIRRGALDMIVFEELVYQEALKRTSPITAQTVSSGLRSYKQQFNSEQQYKAYLADECQGSEKVLRQRVKRSLLIEWMMRTEVENKSVVTPVQLRAYYDKNPQRFTRPDMFAIQTISLFPRNDGKELPISVKKRAEDALRQVSATSTFEDFGLLAEKLSDDDFHVNMGDHKIVNTADIPPQVVKALSGMKPGQVSKMIAFENGYTIVRLNNHIPAGKQPFAEVKTKLKDELTKTKREQLRSALATKLKSTATVESLNSSRG
jgi:peptidyl-prolyl cis-trans isomerase C